MIIRTGRMLFLLMAIAASTHANNITSSTLSIDRFTQISFSDSLHGWVLSETKLYSTRDGGRSYQLNPISNPPAPSQWFVWMSTPDSLTIWLLAHVSNAVTGNRNDYVIRSIDRGAHWDTVNVNPIGLIGMRTFTQICSSDSLSAWICGASSPLDSPPFIMTNDGGRTWNDARIRLNALWYYYTGLDVSGPFISTLAAGSVFIRSKDAGGTWFADTLSQTSSDLADIAFADTLHGWIVGQKGKILHTSNAGDDWKLQQSNTLQDFIAVDAVDSLSAWALGGGSTLFRTRDGGVHWDSVFSSRTALTALSFPDNDHGWLAGEGGLILRYEKGTLTTNRSLSFSIGDQFAYSGTKHIPGQFTTINFSERVVSDTLINGKRYYHFRRSENISWRAEDDSGMFGGRDFYRRGDSLGFYSYNLAIEREDTLVIFGDPVETAYASGYQILSKDSSSVLGYSHKIPIIETIPRSGTPYSLLVTYSPPFFITKYWLQGIIDIYVDLIAASINGIVYGDESYLTAVHSSNGLPVERFSLSQNFPNPFNPSTTISFTLPSRSLVILRVFDVLGREVATLVSEELSAGKHICRWNASGSPSGMYFYRLEAGSRVETRRLLLLK